MKTLLTLLIFSVINFKAMSEQDNIIRVGALAANFLLKTKNYNTNLYDLFNEKTKEFPKIKYIVLVFYPKDSSPGCSIQIKKFADMKQSFKKLETLILGISLDDEKSHNEFCQNKDMEIDLVSDQDAKISNLYGVFNKDGWFRFTQVNRDTIIIRRDPNIDNLPQIINLRNSVSVFNDANEVFKIISDDIKKNAK